MPSRVSTGYRQWSVTDVSIIRAIAYNPGTSRCYHIARSVSSDSDVNPDSVGGLYGPIMGPRKEDVIARVWGT